MIKVSFLYFLCCYWCIELFFPCIEISIHICCFTFSFSDNFFGFNVIAILIAITSLLFIVHEIFIKQFIFSSLIILSWKNNYMKPKANFWLRPILEMNVGVLDILKQIKKLKMKIPGEVETGLDIFLQR